MADFSIGDVAFTGFRVITSRPKAFAVWVALEVVLSLGALLLIVSTFGPTLTQLQAGGPFAHPDPTQSLALVQKMAPFYAFGFLAALVIYPVVYAAMNRAVLRPNDDGFGYLRIGPDEFRQLGLMLLYIVTMIGVLIGVIILMVILGMVIGAVGALAKGTIAAPLVGILVAIVMMVVMYGGLIFIGVRLCLASPLTFATGRIDLFGSWKLTKGRFWPIFGVAVVVFFVMLALYFVLFAIMGSLSVIPGLGINVGQMMFHPDYSSLATVLTPGRVLLQLIQAVIGAVFLPLWLTPPAAIYASLVGTGRAGGQPIAEVFA